MSFRMGYCCGDDVESNTFVYTCSKSGFFDAERICQIVPRRGEGIPERRALWRSSGDVAASAWGEALSLFHNSESYYDIFRRQNTPINFIFLPISGLMF